MSFLKKRSTAWVVLILAIAFSLSFSGGGALKDLRNSTEKIFYDGVHNDGLSLNRDLKVCSEKATNLAEKALEFSSIDQGLANDVKDYAEKLDKAETISDKYDQYTSLRTSVELLDTAFQKIALDDSDSRFVTDQKREFESRMDTISHSPYNEKAAEFNNTLSEFPASLVASLARIKNLELFG